MGLGKFSETAQRQDVWCGVMCTRIIGPFLFDEPPITANVYRDLPSEEVPPQPRDLQPTFIVQQDGVHRIGD
jgi:hypothetical protein